MAPTCYRAPAQAKRASLRCAGWSDAAASSHVSNSASRSAMPAISKMRRAGPGRAHDDKFAFLTSKHRTGSNEHVDAA